MDSGSITKIVIMLALIVFSAYFSATETAFSSFNATRIKMLAEKGNKDAKRVLKLSENYNNLISTILIGNNIVNIAVASLGTVLFVELYGNIGATVSTVVVTVAVLIFGEITPKSIAKDAPERFAMFSSLFISWLIIIFKPLNIIFDGWKKLVSKIINMQEDTKMSQEELLLLVDEVRQEGTIDNDEGKLIKNVIEFSKQRAEDILTNRGDVEAVALDAPKSEIAKAFAQSKFSRLLVYNEGMDDIVGIIHIKDFYTENGITNKKIEKIMTKPIFVQKSMPIDELLKALQAAKSHIAVVVDEYGGTVGIVTMEDVLEELVGEIWDEHDDVTEDVKKLEENKFSVEGLMNFEDFCEMLGVEIATENISVGGWVMEQLGKIAEVGDKFSYKNFDVTVTEIDGRRVSKIEVICHIPDN
ncbi:MAG: HlyC/CorC family transporter, partial [Clostridiales bacterium]|nr:HlyC/CorC family transporter [Candidatus Equinaster intestinalis]